MLKQQQHILVDSPPPLHRFALSEVKIRSSGNKRVKLKAVSALENVNTLAKRQELSFNLNGLTVIFGENGSGKSGYARVIQRACNTGPEGKRILSSIYAPERRLMQASALITVCDSSGNKDNLPWEDGKKINGPSVLCYDSKIANIVVDEDNDVVFRPNELLLLEALRDTCKDIGKFLASERSDLQQKINDALLEKVKGSDIAEDVLSYRDQSDQEIDDMSIFSLDNLDNCENALKIGSEKDLMEQANKLLKCHEDIILVKKRITNLEEELGQIALRLPLALSALKDANKAADIVRKMFGQGYLPGTGEEVWKQLFFAAREFSSRLAYPNEEFPVVRKQARCVLCQQNLENNGVDAMNLFDKFINDRALKTLDEQKENIVLIRKRLESINTELINLSEHKSFASVEAVSQQFGDNFPHLPEQIKAYRDALMEMQTFLMTANVFKLEQLPDLPNNPIKSIEQICEHIVQRVNVYKETAAKQQEKAEEYRNLLARQALTKQLDSYKRVIKLRRCIADVQLWKSRITNQVDKLFEEYGMEHLKRNLNAELEFMKELMSGRELHFVSHGGEGRAKIQLRFKDKDAAFNLANNKILLSDILSEGEHNCVALASFFAQAFVPEGPSTLIFDDPASSIDADRIKIIATRLRKASEQKQVIVFTHNVFFARLLCEKHKCDILKKGIWKYGKNRGVVDEIPFAAMGCKGQVRKINDHIDKLRELEEEQPLVPVGTFNVPPQAMQEKIEACYRRLRMAIEAFAEEEILKKAITRKTPNLSVGALFKMYDNSSEKIEIVKKLHLLYKRVSEQMHKQEIAAVLSLSELKDCFEKFKLCFNEFKNIQSSLGTSSQNEVNEEPTLESLTETQPPNQSEFSSD